MAATRSLVELIDVAAARHGNVSGRRLAELAQEAGHDISHATLNRIRQGTYLSRPSAVSVRAIAYLAGVSEDTAFAGAGMTAPRAGAPYRPPAEAELMDSRQRKALTELVRAFAPAGTGPCHPFACEHLDRLAASAGRLRSALVSTTDKTDATLDEDVVATATELLVCLDEALGATDGPDAVWAAYLASRRVEAPVEVWDR